MNTLAFIQNIGPLEFMILFMLPITGLWIWSLIHCITNKKLTDTNRIIGIVLIVLLGIIGSIIYPFLPREESANSSS